MIKPHGSETLNPLYVEDDAKRARYAMLFFLRKELVKTVRS